MHLLWIGNKNTTFGTANNKTGLHSYYGSLYLFKTKQERDQVFAEYNDFNKSAYKCTINTARKWHLGMTVRQYHQYIESLDFSYVDDLI